VSIESERRLHTVKSDNGNIQIPVSIFIGEGRVNIAEICSGLSTRDEHRESWVESPEQISSINNPVDKS
jgi:hypothetical protein